MQRENIQTRTVDLTDIEIRSGEQTGDGSLVITGYAAVFDVLSEDLGGFRERIAPTAFDGILASNPDVHMVWDHDTRYVLGRTKSGTLELSAVPERGLRVFNRVAPTSYAQDLQVLMERGDLDQMSFAFIPGEETWTYPEDDEDDIIVEVRTVEALFDVCVCAQGAYPQTQSSITQNSRQSRMEAAIDAGKLVIPSGPDTEAAAQDERALSIRRHRLALAKAR